MSIFDENRLENFIECLAKKNFQKRDEEKNCDFSFHLSIPFVEGKLPFGYSGQTFPSFIAYLL